MVRGQEGMKKRECGRRNYMAERAARSECTRFTHSPRLILAVLGTIVHGPTGSKHAALARQWRTWSNQGGRESIRCNLLAWEAGCAARAIPTQVVFFPFHRLTPPNRGYTASLVLGLQQLSCIYCDSMSPV